MFASSSSLSIRRAALAGPLALLLALGSACTSKATKASDASSSQSTATSAPASASSATPAIDIKNFKFSPNPLRAKAGVAIEVTNSDDTAHTVTADSGSKEMFDTQQIAGAGKSTVTITAPGTYKFHCDIHNYMTGVIQVTA